MKSLIVSLFLTVVAAYAQAELQYHPQAVLHYLEMEDREMARKVRSIVNGRGLPSSKPSFLPSFQPSFSPSFKPSGFPTGLPLAVVSTQSNDCSKGKSLFHCKLYSLTYFGLAKYHYFEMKYLSFLLQKAREKRF